MHRVDWPALPDELRAAVCKITGPVRQARPVDRASSHFAAVLEPLRGRSVFCKGVRLGDPAVDDALRNEALVTRHLPPQAAGLLWQVERAGWLLLGFEYIRGHHADLRPGSPDVPSVVASLVTLAIRLTPSPVMALPSMGGTIMTVAPWRRMRDDPPSDLDPWTRSHLGVFTAMEPMAAEMASGHTLCHTNVHEGDLILSGGANLVDWGTAALAAPWFDLATLVVRLVHAGHTPPQAERWVQHTGLWGALRHEVIEAAAVEMYGLYELQRHRYPTPERRALASAAGRWARHRFQLRQTRR